MKIIPFLNTKTQEGFIFFNLSPKGNQVLDPMLNKFLNATMQ